MRFCSVTPLILSIIVALLSCKAAQRDISALEGAKNDSEPQIARFDKALSELERSLVGATSLDNAATRFAEGSARIAAYRLQALGELYLKEGDWFKDFYEEFKLVEDTIGNYDKWVTILKKAPDTIDKPIRKDLEAKKALAFSKMKDLLSKNNWYGSKRLRGDTIRNELRTIKWESIKKDRKLVLEGVKERLRDLRDTKYQVDTLEKGNGLHELRRDMKWILIEMRVLNGLILKSVDACPAAGFAPLTKLKIAESKYAELLPSPTESDPCFIPECLLLGLVQAVEDFGNLKDESEFRSNTGKKTTDEVPEDLRKQATKFYAFLQQEGLFAKTHAAIEACIQ